MIRICGISVYTLLAAVIFTAPVLGQIGINTVTARFGIIDAPNANKPIFYPELEIGGKAFLPSLSWSAYWGYWDEAIREAAVSDQAVYSTRGQILGGRILFDPSKAFDRWVIPVIIFGGISHQFISPTYVGGSDLTGSTIYRGPASGNSIELGARAGVNISGSFLMDIEGHRLFHFGASANRSVYTVGLTYHF